MRTFKELWLMVLMVAITCCFTACSSGSDDELNNEDFGEIVADLQGTWVFHSGTETIMGMTVTISKSDLDNMKKQMEAAENARIEIWDETLKFSGTKVNGVPFTIGRNNQLIIEGMDIYDDIAIYIKSVSSSKLVLREDFNMEGFDFVADMEYHKK